METAPSPSTALRSRLSADGVIAAGLVAVALVPLVAAVVTHLGRDWVPAQDLAVLDLRTRDVLSGHPPLVGPYSRYGWSHPGPLLFWLLAPFSLVTGGAAWGVLVGGVVLQMVMVIWIGRLAWTSGGLVLVAPVMVIVALTYASIGTSLVLEPWNPYLGVVAFMLYVLQSWRLAAGDTRRLVGWVLVASLLAQSHVGYLPLVAAAVAVVAGCWWIDRRGARPWQPGRRRMWAAVGVTVVVWLPVAIDGVLVRSGNLGRLLDGVRTGNGGEPVAGWSTGVGLLTREFQPRPPWLGGADPRDGLTDAVSGASAWLLVVPVGLLVIGGLAAWASGRRADRRWVALTACLTAAGVVALSRTTGFLVPYLFLWRLPLAMFVVVSSAWAVTGWWRSQRPGTVPRAWRWTAAAVAGTVIAAGAVPLAGDVVDRRERVMAFEQDAAIVLSQLQSSGSPPVGVQVRFVGRTLGGLPGIVVNELDRQATPVGVPPSLGFQFGEQRVVAEPVEVWVVSEEGWLTSELVSAPGGRVLARHEPLDPASTAELVDLQTRIGGQLDRAGLSERRQSLDSPLVGFALDGVGGIDQADLDRLAGLDQGVEDASRCRCAVVAFPSAAVPSWAPPPRPHGPGG